MNHQIKALSLGLSTAALQAQEPGLGFQACSGAVAVQAAVGADQAMAGDDQRHEIGGLGAAHRPGGARLAELAGKLAIR